MKKTRKLIKRALVFSLAFMLMMSNAQMASAVFADEEGDSELFGEEPGGEGEPQQDPQEEPQQEPAGGDDPGQPDPEPAPVQPDPEPAPAPAQMDLPVITVDNLAVSFGTVTSSADAGVKDIIVRNGCNTELYVSAAISDANDAYRYSISEPLDGKGRGILGPDGLVRVKVFPKDGLGAGDYDADVTIRAINGNGDMDTEVVSLSMKVKG